MRKIWVTGSNGQVGSALKEVAAQKKDNHETFFFTDKAEVDITDENAVIRFIEKNGIDTIVNCAAYTAVDAAENHPQKAYAVNYKAVEYLAKAAKKRNLWLIHISSDYVFGGNHHRPIKEEELPSPQGIYADSKLKGEQAIIDIAPAHAVILRTSWVYSHTGNNFVRTMRTLARHKKSVDVVCDQIGTPTYAMDIAEAILTILRHGKQHLPQTPSIFHFSNEGSCSWYDFANAIFACSNTRCDINPIATEEFPTLAKRPSYSVLDKTKFKQFFHAKIPYWRDSLQRCIQRIQRKEGFAYRVGIIGSGFIASGLTKLLMQHDDFEISGVLTRSAIENRNDFPAPQLLTHSLTQLLDHSDIIVECSGDAIYATDMIDKICRKGLPVVTMNSEFHITTGSYFVDKGVVTEAEGDQPGVLAALHEEALSMGFRPVLYANIKGFLNENPTRKEMEFWGAKNNLSLEMVTSFTDGTKVQIEQVLVANGLGANIIKEGLVKLKSDDMLEGGTKLVEMAKNAGVELPVSDYVLSPKLPAGVFVLAEHRQEQHGELRYYKLGDGPYYVIERTYHLCHLEIVKTLRRILNGGDILLNNGPQPKLSVAAVAKRTIKPGYELKKAIGSFDVRGEAVYTALHPQHVPIGLLADATFKREVKAGELVTFDDVELPDTLAYRIWKEEILPGVLNAK